MIKKVSVVSPTYNEIYTNLLTVFKHNIEKMNMKIDILTEKIDKNEKRMIRLDDKMNELISLMNEGKIKNKLRNVIEEKILFEGIITREIVLKNLSLRSIKGDLNLIKKYYLLEGKKSIELMNSRRFEYWRDGRWHIDMDGHYIGKVLCNNLQKLYTSVNYLSNLDNNLNDFMQNQVHINKISNEKYRKELVKNLKLEL